ncbi:hypothetical protein Q4506_09495 [Colwellia sp. 4_MG-2023]|uniref:hypothetical protein n=1 Tax=unclassified Colwellia TaxID=196834 RepID=UPI0026E149FE|nr:MULTISPECIES: hypothetical protein [unclassified Colwellia]MDO6507037.1 hypothetical protein [Colwellia sp. 5_MG-2023]MDO6555917.1 hypothetical protein [Colwellia sp. 4_MG-2023]
MAKSSLAKGSKKANHVRNSKNVVPIHFTIPTGRTKYKKIRELDVSHLIYQRKNKGHTKIDSRIPYIRKFCDMAKQYVANGKSATAVTAFYKNLDAYIRFCDAVDVDPFTEAGYLKYVGNDGELRHRIKIYQPSKKLWQRSDGEELGIKESTAGVIASDLRKALSWCGLASEVWRNQHRGFYDQQNSIKGYSDTEEKTLVTRLSDLFFALAPQLIAAKEENLALPEELLVTVNLEGYTEVVSIPTSLETKLSIKDQKTVSVRSVAAFNMAMGAAYHLMCFFTSLNDTNIRTIAHPIDVHTDERDKSLKTVKVSSFKARANKEVDALLSNDIDESIVNFDVEKRDGVKFITTLEKLSKLYGNGEEYSELLFFLNSKNQESDRFNITDMNKHLALKLNLLSPYRKTVIRWFKELFDTYRNQQFIILNTTVNTLGRVVTSKIVHSTTSQTKATQGTTNASYCILSCYTDLPLKGILLPLTYSKKNENGDIAISFKYRDGNTGSFIIPATDIEILRDIEQFANELADKQASKNYERLLLRRGSGGSSPMDWDDISPISANLMTQWAIAPNDYFISLQSSRWREMTSSQEYDDNSISRVQAALQNTLATINKHYANGDSNLNKTILSQGMQVLEKIGKDQTLEEAKEQVANKFKIPMISYDEWQKKKAKTNPNGTNCNGKQDIPDGKNTQRETNNAIGANLACTEYDKCYICKSAKAVDEVQAIYKLISFIDVLKDALNQFPNAKEEVFEKIEAFEYILNGASSNVYEQAMKLFKKNGRHPRVSVDHAIVSIHQF